MQRFSIIKKVKSGIEEINPLNKMGYFDASAPGSEPILEKYEVSPFGSEFYVFKKGGQYWQRGDRKNVANYK